MYTISVFFHKSNFAQLKIKIPLFKNGLKFPCSRGRATRAMKENMSLFLSFRPKRKEQRKGLKPPR